MLLYYTIVMNHLKIYIYQSHVCLLSGVQCPVHSHYELCGSGCEVTCHSLAPPTGCRSSCTEGCVCDQGFVRSGDHCVPLSQCGCLYGKRYYLLYQQFYPGNNCEEVCTCTVDGKVSEHAKEMLGNILQF